MFSKLFAQLRIRNGLSQSEAAEIFGVSRQAVQKWENGANLPETEKLVKIASYFNVSLDYLICGKDHRSVEELRIDNEAEPSYSSWHSWEAYQKNILLEYTQTADEGFDIQKYHALFDAASQIPDSKEKEQLADLLYKMICSLSVRADYAYNEPNDFDMILGLSDGYEAKYSLNKDIKYTDRLRGAWYGRICGCLLGKPVEGMKYDELTTFLTRSGNFPMHRYIVKSEAKACSEGLKFPIENRAYDDGILNGMPVDDDTNYIILAYLAVKQYGLDFQSEDMMNIWLKYQGKNAYCTAERAAYRNFVNGFLPPQSAVYKNPFREWIGAQIRGDFFGWINPGRPQKAAEMAWHDAILSHVKNGIYGEMWVAAMLAGAASGMNIEDSLCTGLSYIPKTSRLYAAITNVLNFYHNDGSSEDFFAGLHQRWDDYNGHHWCHTISNAEIVAAALLFGKGDYEKSVCLAVQQGFDTDCNGATVGSVVGMIIGASRIPSRWKDKINGILNTSIFGYESVNIEEMVKETENLSNKG